MLVDAGAEVRGYDSDITRTFPVSGRFSPEQAELYALVLRANRAAIELCAPGTEWRDVHRAAGLVLAEGLVSFGLLRGEPESLVESGAVHVFFPHGVGHMVGLGARDAGEVLPGRDQRADAFPRLRVDLPLEPGYVMTVEPGVYFVRRSSTTSSCASATATRSTGSAPSRCSASAGSASRTTCSSPRTGTRF